ncbi:GNAT family N-acetyltransferase [Lutispora saccharofermentans]|uniref:GNAT family N-acetyltransferase n=1 Tax=Lutispora saccharofermentans TaxID=3024236 RepID=A0ABT1NFD9_9FIRM|nr:GNAT family N-acetyltransferase [Lutispora saccharofermentans]MCQ1529948.1 GNAT family N-acetyltransferase [Lutispora saccharofermentans]
MNFTFQDYYYGYLSIDKKELEIGKRIFSSDQRNKPLNGQFVQYLISTHIDGRLIFSVAPQYYDDLFEFIKGQAVDDADEIIEMLDIFFSNKLESFKLRKMYRLIPGEDYDIWSSSNSSAVKLTKEIFMEALENIDEAEKTEAWESKKGEILEDRKFVVLDGKKVVSACKISDIDFGGGNIAVWTDSDYRNKGFGKEVVTEAVKWCIYNSILPIYWVDAENTASISLAKSLGFEVKSQEIVASITL